MSATTNGSAIVDILSDRAALEAHFGIHLDSDESDLDVPSDDEWTDYGIKAIRNNECKNSIKSNVLLAQAMTVIMQPVTRMTLLLMQVTVMVSH